MANSSPPGTDNYTAFPTTGVPMPPSAGGEGSDNSTYVGGVPSADAFPGLDASYMLTSPNADGVDNYTPIGCTGDDDVVVPQ